MVSARPLFVAALVLVSGSALPQEAVVPPSAGVPGAAEIVPGLGHDLALAALAAGDFATALETATADHRAAIRVGGRTWIDSIASAAVLGECLFETGDLAGAVARYEESLVVAASLPDWLLAVQFPNRPLGPLRRPRVAGWGRSERNTMPAAVPDRMSIRMQGANPDEVLRRGGTLTAVYDRPVRPQEIVRGLVIALYRLRSLAGGLAAKSRPLADVIAALARRPAPPNHWAQAWIDVALGTAHWAQGKADLAVPLLNRGLLAGNALDHPLTCWALIVLGRVQLDAGQAALAAKLFEEATYTAADYGDLRALEEAFQWTAAAHRAAGTRGPAATVRAASQWARSAAPLLHGRLLAAEAEGLAAAGDPRGAARSLGQIDARLLRGPPGRGTLGAEAAYAAALVGYADGDLAAADGDLDRALGIARVRTPRLFQTAQLLAMLRAGNADLTSRESESFLAVNLADPGALDFAADPLGALACLTSPRPEAHEAWCELAAERDDDSALDAAEATKRARWLSAQPLGGRRVAVERLLSADPATLAPSGAAQRAALANAVPDLPRIVEAMADLRGRLAAALAAANADPAVAGAPVAADPDAWRAYADLARARGRVVAAVAAGREAVPIDFPPLARSQEIRGRLAPRQLILSFHWTGAGLWAALESKDRFATWRVRQAAGLPDEIRALARGLCLFDASAPVTTEKLLAGDWRGSAERIERMLFENSKVTLAEGIDELVIVPDGWLWYVPFELVPVASNRGEPAASRPLLRDVCRIRYCPTRSLATSPGERRPPGPVGVRAGRMVRGDKPPTAAETLADMTAAVEGVVPLEAAARGPALELAASVVDTLVVFEELVADDLPAARPLLLPVQGDPGVTFAGWLAPPRRRPGMVVLPGFQTPLSDGLDKPPGRPGDDLFMAVTDLLAAGARTALVSRWRAGGGTCVELVEEFVRDAAVAEPPPASESWRRAVDVIMPEPPDLAREPRLKPSPDAPLVDSSHPFLWAGYLLVDQAAATPAAAVPADPFDQVAP